MNSERPTIPAPSPTDPIMTANEAAIWARTAEPNEYLARFLNDNLDDVSDPGSRCGYGDDTLAAVEKALAARGLTLVATDVGLKVKMMF